MFKYKTYFDSDSLRVIVSENTPYLKGKLQSLRESIGARTLYLAVKEAESATSLVISSDNAQQKPFTYNLEATPCGNVSGDGVCTYPDGALQRFPDDALLQEVGQDGYMGAAISNENGDIIGLLVGLFDCIKEPITFKSQLFGNLAEQLSTYIQKCHLDKRTHSHLSLLNELQSIAKTGVWELQRKTNQVFWSDEIYHIYGVPTGATLSPEEALGFYAPHSQTQIRDAFENLQKNLAPYDLVLEFVDAAGNEKWVRTTGRAEAGPDRALLRAYGVFEDITKSKTLELKAIERAE